MPHAPTLITAAVLPEVKPLIKALGLDHRDDAGDRWRTATPPASARAEPHPGDGVVLTLTGMGAARAAEAVAAALDVFRPGRVLTVGVAGALDPALAVGDVVAPHRVIDAATGEPLSPTLRRADGSDAASAIVRARPGILVTADALADSPDAKHALRTAHAADAVDMETAAIARACNARGVRWLSIRAISDDAATALPPELAEMVTDAGQPDTGAIGRWALRSPRRLAALVRLGRSTGKAAERLAGAVLEALRIAR